MHSNATASQLLATIEAAFALTPKELGQLFHVDPTSIQMWRKQGIPAEHRAGVDQLVELVRILASKFPPPTLPHVVRARSAWLGNRTVLQTIRWDGIDSIHHYLYRFFGHDDPVYALAYTNAWPHKACDTCSVDDRFHADSVIADIA